MENTDEVVELLRRIEQNQVKAQPGLGTAFGVALSGVASFVIALGIDQAFEKTFALIPGSPLLQAWLQAIGAVAFGFVLLWIVNSVVQPSLIVALDV